MRRSLLSILALLILPGAAHAAVRIDEVAWMGTAANSNAEWMELANTGSAPVDLSGWKITSSSGSPTIALSGTIAANGFFLLERTSDDSVPGVAADLIYTGSLTNSGATLTLADAGGTAVDVVVGGDGWSAIGGDNTTKDTAQRVESGWVTAAPTPRAATAGAPIASDPSPEGSTTSQTQSAGGATYVPPPSSLSIDAGPDREVPLNVPVTFSASVKTKSGSADQNAELAWNFGDGSTGTGNPVEKTYRYPGTYLVHVRANDGDTVAIAEFEASVAAAAVRIARISGDGITLANDGADRIDLSGWRLSAGGATFRIPDGTLVLAQSNLLLAWSVMDLPIAFEAVLSYPNGIFAARFDPAPPPQPAPDPISYSEVQAEPSAHVTNVSASAYAPETARAPVAEVSLAAAGAAHGEADTTAVPPAAQAGSLLRSHWTIGFAGFLTLAAGAFLIL
jgi:hypothetical protein